MAAPPQASKPRTAFGHHLRAELDKSGVSIRELARRLDGGNIDRERRNLTRWITGGVKATRENRREVAVALGLNERTFDSDDDEESELMDELTYALRRLVQSEIGRARDQEWVA